MARMAERATQSSCTVCFPGAGGGPGAGGHVFRYGRVSRCIDDVDVFVGIVVGSWMLITVAGGTRLPDIGTAGCVEPLSNWRLDVYSWTVGGARR